MTSFYAPRSSFDGDVLVLPAEESHHAVKVLRLQRGDQIVVVDGEGGWYRAELVSTKNDTAEGKVIETRYEVGEPKYALTIGLAILHRRERYETFLEKAVELGVQEVVPLQTARSGTKWRPDRAGRIVIAAMKQCGRSRVPTITDPLQVSRLPASNDTAGYICHGPGTGYPLLANALSARSSQRIRILVGPEGGFTNEEVDTAVALGYEAVSLGGRRLRAETAAITAAAAVMLCDSSNVTRAD